MIEQRFRMKLGAGVSAGEAFDWHARPGAFERLVPGWEDVRLEGPAARLEVGAQQTVSIGLGPMRLDWRSEITAVTAGECFRDVQLQGPFAYWEHRHRMHDEQGGCVLEDDVSYRLPVGALGRAAGGARICARLERLFAYRHRILRHDLTRWRIFADREPLDVLVSGASGMVGRALCSFLGAGGHRVRRLVRREPQSGDEYRWDPRSGTIDERAVEGTDAVIHLAGESIASGRWNLARKQRIVESRVRGTRQVVEAIRAAQRKPRTLLCASAIGIYGSREGESLDEQSEHGQDFLASLCADWEAEALALTELRVLPMRFGMILSPAGGALRKMLLPFQVGAGGRIGSGEQWVSWIAIDDVLGALQHALLTPDLRGPLNVVAPQPVTNEHFTCVLARVLSRPHVAPLPAFVVRRLFGEMGDALLLASQRVTPSALQASGFEFAYPELEPALRHQLGRMRREES